MTTLHEIAHVLILVAGAAVAIAGMTATLLELRNGNDDE